MSESKLSRSDFCGGKVIKARIPIVKIPSRPETPISPPSNLCVKNVSSGTDPTTQVHPESRRVRLLDLRPFPSALEASAVFERSTRHCLRQRNPRRRHDPRHPQHLQILLARN